MEEDNKANKNTAGEEAALNDTSKMPKMPQGPPPIHPGVFLSFLFLIFVIVDIFLSGFQYRVSDMRWSKTSPYRVIGVLEITQVVVAFCVAIYGIFAFKTYKTLGGVRFLFLIHI